MVNIIKSLFISLLLINSLYAEDAVDKATKQAQKEAQILKLKQAINNVDNDLEDNIWIKRYNNYLTYRKIETELEKIKKDAKKYGRWKGKKYQELSYQLKNKIKIKENELSLISEYKDSPIGSLIKPNEIVTPPSITNPFNIIEAFSYIQKLDENVRLYQETNEALTTTLSNINQKLESYKKLNKLDPSKDKQQALKYLETEMKDFVMVVDIVSTTSEVYGRKIDQVKQEVHDGIADEVSRTIKLLLIIVVLIAISYAVKVGIKKYITDDDDQHYTSQKLVNFILIFIIVFIILFSYIDNASYLVTVLGFASAGIAIALKDWFMSIFGWFAIMTSGAIKVGDRIKVQRDNLEVVGDVLDISLFKIAVREDVTLTTYMNTRRGGRVFFIPNNYIFTDLISNYTYDGLRTVWDGVDIYITFDSNHQKAMEIATEIVTKHSKGFTELTKKRLHKLKTKYVLRSTNPEPRIFAFTEPYGIVISSWYYTNSYATLPSRTKISLEILDAFKAAEDIEIAYPTQSLRVTNHNLHPAHELLPGHNHQGLFDAPPSN
jgi:small-conductance mechanosensitive channel